MSDGSRASTWDPVVYERFKSHRQRPVHDLLRLVRPGRGGTAVDLGCGTGEYTVWLHQRSGADETLGIDSSETMLEDSDAHRRPGVSFRLGNLRDLDGSFDVVFSNAALQWLPDHPALLSGLVSHLAVGGQLAVQVPANFDHPSHTIADEVGREFGLEPQHRTISVLPPARYAEVLHRLGLVDLDVSLRIYGVPMARTDEVVDWVSGSLLTAYRRQLDDSRYEEFESAYRERLLDALGDPSGARPYYFAFPRILFWARRPF